MPENLELLIKLDIDPQTRSQSRAYHVELAGSPVADEITPIRNDRATIVADIPREAWPESLRPQSLTCQLRSNDGQYPSEPIRGRIAEAHLIARPTIEPERPDRQ